LTTGQVPILQVDAGHFFSDAVGPKGMATDVRIKNDWMLRGFHSLKLAAANVSYRELPYLSIVMASTGYAQRVKDFPALDSLVSANVTPADATRHGFKPYVIREVSGKRIGAKPIRVGIVGFTAVPSGAKIQKGRWIAEGFAIEEPVAAAARVIPEVRAKCDLLVVLAYMDRDTAKKLGTTVPGIDAIIAAQQFGVFNGVDEAGDAVVAYASNQTKQLGELRFYRDEKSPDAAIANYIHRDIPLDAAIPDDAPMLKLTYDARADFTRAQRDARLLGDTPEEIKAFDEQRKLLAAKSPFVGSEQCASCHMQEYAIWKDSRHAHAFKTLEVRQRELDMSCTPCHTVGQGERGGFQDAKLTPQLVNVQCESCHTPGKAHVAKPAKGFGGVPTPALCVKCHNKTNDPDFDFPSYWEKIKHGNGLSPSTPPSAH
jgi:predicted CXXCH cytochrome family protein